MRLESYALPFWVMAIFWTEMFLGRYSMSHNRLSLAHSDLYVSLVQLRYLHSSTQDLCFWVFFVSSGCWVELDLFYITFYRSACLQVAWRARPCRSSFTYLCVVSEIAADVCHWFTIRFFWKIQRNVCILLKRCF